MSLKTILERSDSIQYDILLKGLTEQTVRGISAAQKEPEWMLEHRLQCFKQFQKMEFPKRGPSLKKLNLDDIVYFAKPSQEHEGYANKREDVPLEIKEKFQKL